LDFVVDTVVSATVTAAFEEELLLLAARSRAIAAEAGNPPNEEVVVVTTEAGSTPAVADVASCFCPGWLVVPGTPAVATFNPTPSTEDSDFLGTNPLRRKSLCIAGLSGIS